MRFFEIYLPMPTSINAAHALTKGRYNPKTKKYERSQVRSSENNEWRDAANLEWRRQFPAGVKRPFKGRLSVVYVFVWPINEPSLLSDIGNREKVLSDFLQGKFFIDDNQIDEQRQFRKIWGAKRPYAWVRVYEMSDKRFIDPALLFA